MREQKNILLHRTTNESPLPFGPQYFCTNSIDAIKAFVTAQEKNDHQLLLTFDDGFKSNLDLLPFLEKHDVKSIFFITTEFVSGEAYPYEYELAAVINEKTKLIFPHLKNEIKLKTDQQRGAIYGKVRQILNLSTHTQREKYMNALSQLNNYLRKSYQNEIFMDWADIKKIADLTFAVIGSHTRYHTVLTSQRLDRAYSEISKSKKIIEQHINKKVTFFAYPYGYNNIVIQEMVKFAGYKKAFLASRKINFPNKIYNRNYTLPRKELNFVNI